MARHAAHFLLGATLLLVGLGLVMLVSTGAWAEAGQEDAYFSVKRQFLFLSVGIVLCAALSRIPYLVWHRIVPWIYGLGCLLLVLCFVPMVGQSINGSARWVNLRAVGLTGAQVQPSEFAKLSVVMALAAWYARIGPRHREFGAGFMVPLGLVLVPVALVGREVDLGAASLIGLASFAVMFVAGANMWAVVGSILAGLAAIAGAIRFIPNRMTRFVEFLDVVKNPMAHLQDTGMQQVRAMMAFSNGGVGGAGLGNGEQKVMGLPYAHTDFIFPMVGEELGLVATLAVVFCYVVMLVSGMLIALHAPERFGKLLGMGLVALLALQATLNIAVTTACLPNKGLPLPLVSYGGSNLLFCLTAVGLLLNLHRHAVHPEATAAAALPRRITPRA